MTAIVTEKLTHDYKRHFWSRQNRALDNLNLTVNEGEIFGYLGANGAGKTTTIKNLVGLQRQSSGSARIFGIDTRKVDARKMLGFQPENPYFYEYLSARESLRFYAALCKLPSQLRNTRSEELLEFVGLNEAKDVRVGEFSKGMRQRLGIAQSLIHKPKLIILDEPMSGLDPVGRKQVRDLIMKLRDDGFTVFFSSHILADVEMIADRVGLLIKGRLKALGTVDELVKTRLHAVEVITQGISESVRQELSAAAEKESVLQADYIYNFRVWKEADEAIRKVVESGGNIRGVKAEKETLEEYFMRENNASITEVADWSGGADK
ncbi:MAG: ABC transporter ATP-binding protein [Planctomycetota bacterium]|jgi:ABC-2 type transport system ATP-binding protein